MKKNLADLVAEDLSKPGSPAAVDSAAAGSAHQGVRSGVFAATGGLALATVLAIATPSQAAKIVLSTGTDRGWFNDVGLHLVDNQNTFTGTVNPNRWKRSGRGLNSFHIWDVSALAGMTVVSAKLRLGQDLYGVGSAPTETIEVYDVTTPRVDLLVGHERDSELGMTIHGDLKSGDQYASFDAVSDELVYEISLSAEAVADINAALGGYFAVGLHNATDGGEATDDGVRFDQLDLIDQLVLTIPEPSSFALLLLGSWALLAPRRRSRIAA